MDDDFPASKTRDSEWRPRRSDRKHHEGLPGQCTLRYSVSPSERPISHLSPCHSDSRYEFQFTRFKGDEMWCAETEELTCGSELRKAFCGEEAYATCSFQEKGSPALALLALFLLLLFVFVATR